MSFFISMAKIIVLLFCLCFDKARADVQCNSTTDGYSGTCTGHYCFNIADKIRGCVNFYRMVRDDNIGVGQMHLLGGEQTGYICTQPYCGKYETANMPTQVLAAVNCTDDTGSPSGICQTGPCYVGNDLANYSSGNHEATMQRKCMHDWFAVTSFKQLIIYEVPPLKGHPACFFDDNKFNCMCKDPGCNKNATASKVAATDDKLSTCHKMACQPEKDSTCGEKYLGNETCKGQMCYYLKTAYDFKFDNVTYKETNYVRDCLNYSYKDPIGDLNFVTGFQFGEKSHSVFYPCLGDYCNAKTGGNSAAAASKAGILLTILSFVFLAYQ